MKQQDQLIRNKSFKVLAQSDLEVKETQVEEIEKKWQKTRKNWKEASQNFMKKEAEERQEEIQK